MEAEIARHDRMSESGSSLLRLIQNESTPLLDLFVREAVQNSMDAAKDEADHVNVEFVTGSFTPSQLNKHFDCITDALNKRFPNENYQFLSIRDSNTAGLTGPLHTDDVTDPAEFGNLLKLVYEICKPQQKDGAGGSWGLGKTIYFRLGIGLVIYYSRIFQDGHYQSRLAACFVEDERKPDAIIPKAEKIGRGIAWWGKAVGVNKTVPLEDVDKIKPILDVFGMQPYLGDETGTTVIIPYIDENKLLSDCYTEQFNDSGEKIGEKVYWLNSIAEYLTVAIQRWYGPRLLNKFYHGAWLAASVNKKKLKISEMLPLFKLLREFYISAITDKLPEEDSYISDHTIDVKKENIFLRSIFTGSGCAGKLIFAEVSSSQLEMTPPDNIPDPFCQITNSFFDNNDGNLPIITYVRKPAMIVSYDFKAAWTRDLQRSTPERYIIGIFVLGSENRLKGCYKNSLEEELTLEEYIRSGEKADHAEWGDQSINGKKYSVVDKIQRGVSVKILHTFNSKSEIPDTKQNIGLGHTLADILLPPEDFGVKAAGNNLGGGNKKGKTDETSKAVFRSYKTSYFTVIGNNKYTNEGTVINFEAFFRNKQATLSLNVIAGSESYDALLWENDAKGLGKQFPFKLIKFSVEKIKKNIRDKDFQTEMIITDETSLCMKDNITIQLLKSEKFNTPYAVQISTPDAGYTLKGQITFDSNEYDLMYNIKLKED